MDSARRVCSGTWGEIWVGGGRISECFGAQAKLNHTKQDVDLCGQMATDTKVLATKGTGSLSLYKVTTRFVEYAESIIAGRDERATIISNLDDPDAYGAERVALYNVSFDDLTLFDWKSKTLGQVTIPFTFTSYQYLDRINEG